MKTVLTQSVSDAIRDHVREVYLNPALRKGESTFTVSVGAVHKDLRLSNRVPQVCSALDSKKLLDENHLRIISKTGPPSGQSTTVTFTYEILSGKRPSSLPNPLHALRGVAKEIFSKLGGGEHFIQSERNSFGNDQKR